MPKKGVVKCRECSKEFNGTLPDDESVGYPYMDIYGGIKDSKLIRNLKQHHHETARLILSEGQGIGGHEDFDVFLKDGSIGVINAISYCITYKELGKER